MIENRKWCVEPQFSVSGLTKAHHTPLYIHDSHPREMDYNPKIPNYIRNINLHTIKGKNTKNSQEVEYLALQAKFIHLGWPLKI